MENSTGKTEWNISVPIFKNTVILQQLGIAVSAAKVRFSCQKLVRSRLG